MVIAAISVLSILVTEFTYVAQINQKLAFDGLDQLKAHYLAKSGLKLSLLRLRPTRTSKTYANGMVKAAGGGAAASAWCPRRCSTRSGASPSSIRSRPTSRA